MDLVARLDKLTGPRELTPQRRDNPEAMHENGSAVLVVELLEEREAPNPQLLGGGPMAGNTQ